MAPTPGKQSLLPKEKRKNADETKYHFPKGSKYFNFSVSLKFFNIKKVGGKEE